MWKHHHEHSFIHSCFSLLSVTLAVFCWIATAGIWYGVSAGTVTSSGTVNLSAQVGSVNEGPSSTGGGSVLPPFDKLPPPPPPTPTTKLPSVTAVGDTSEVIYENGQEPIYIFRTPYPKFSGSINIPEALFEFTIHTDTVRTATMKNIGSIWAWQSYLPIDSGSYILYIRALSETAPEFYADTQVRFYIAPDKTPKDQPTPQRPPSETINPPKPTTPTPPTENITKLIILQINESSKKINPGGSVFAKLRLLGFEKSDFPLKVNYEILDKNQQVVGTMSDTLTFANALHLSKIFYTAPNIKEGVYAINAQVKTPNKTLDSADTFQVEGKPTLYLATGTINLSTLYLSLFLLGLVFFLIAYFEYLQFQKIQKNLHLVTEADLNKA